MIASAFAPITSENENFGLSEMLAFPNGRHDDQVDSVSQLLTWRQNVWMPMQAPIVVPFVYSRSRQFLG